MWLTPLILPPIALNLLDLQIDISLWTFMGRLALLTAVAFVTAWIGRWLMGPDRLTRANTHLDGLAVLSMLFFVVGVFDGVTEMTIDMPRHVLIACALAMRSTLACRLFLRQSSGSWGVASPCLSA